MESKEGRQHQRLQQPPPPLPPLPPPTLQQDGSYISDHPRWFLSSTATVRPAKKRGRPRKHGTLARGTRGQAAPAPAQTSSKTSKKSDVKTGKGSITPHIITIAEGEDVEEKLRMIMGQSKSEVCVMSASGTVSNVWFHPPASEPIHHEVKGQYQILSLNLEKTHGLNVLLSGSNGIVIGGKVYAQLLAASPIQVVLGAFRLSKKKDTCGSGVQLLPTPVGRASTQGGISFQSPGESSESNVNRNDEHRQAEKK